MSSFQVSEQAAHNWSRHMSVTTYISNGIALIHVHAYEVVGTNRYPSSQSKHYNPIPISGFRYWDMAQFLGTVAIFVPLLPQLALEVLCSSGAPHGSTR